MTKEQAYQTTINDLADRKMLNFQTKTALSLMMKNLGADE